MLQFHIHQVNYYSYTAYIVIFMWLVAVYKLK